MKENLIKRAANLLSVKSLVTLVLTAVFAYQSVTGQISQDFMTIYAVVIAFYFGTQARRARTPLRRTRRARHERGKRESIFSGQGRRQGGLPAL